MLDEINVDLGDLLEEQKEMQEWTDVECDNFTPDVLHFYEIEVDSSDDPLWEFSKEDKKCMIAMESQGCEHVWLIPYNEFYSSTDLNCLLRINRYFTTDFDEFHDHITSPPPDDLFPSVYSDDSTGMYWERFGEFIRYTKYEIGAEEFVANFI